MHETEIDWIDSFSFTLTLCVFVDLNWAAWDSGPEFAGFEGAYQGIPFIDLDFTGWARSVNFLISCADAIVLGRNEIIY